MGDYETARDHLNAGKLVEALTLARKMTRAAPGDMKARALLIEILFSRGEQAAVDNELAAIERDKPNSPELKQLKARFKKRR